MNDSTKIPLVVNELMMVNGPTFKFVEDIPLTVLVSIVHEHLKDLETINLYVFFHRFQHFINFPKEKILLADTTDQKGV